MDVDLSPSSLPSTYYEPPGGTQSSSRLLKLIETADSWQALAAISDEFGQHEYVFGAQHQDAMLAALPKLTSANSREPRLITLIDTLLAQQSQRRHTLLQPLAMVRVMQVLVGLRHTPAPILFDPFMEKVCSSFGAFPSDWLGWLTASYDLLHHVPSARWAAALLAQVADKPSPRAFAGAFKCLGRRRVPLSQRVLHPCLVKFQSQFGTQRGASVSWVIWGAGRLGYRPLPGWKATVLEGVRRRWDGLDVRDCVRVAWGFAQMGMDMGQGMELNLMERMGVWLQGGEAAG